MANLLLRKGNETFEINFDKESSPLLAELLFAHHFSPVHPCGGRGICQKCSVTLTDAKGTRDVLSCQTRLTEDCEVLLPARTENWFIEEPKEQAISSFSKEDAFGIAVDIGSTTVVLCLFDLTTGALLSTASAPNPQRVLAADVMGRIRAAMDKKAGELQKMILACLTELRDSACKKAGLPEEMISSCVITGNTTMLCLLTGTDPSSMAKAPFAMPDAFGKEVSLPGFDAYLPCCMHAFVGADITCAVLASGLLDRTETILLADIGTNGELALWKNGKLYVTSTAAGPAFEGVGIACGCGAVEGAIDHVDVEGEKLRIHKLGETEAKGLCGSGLIDAAAAGLKLGLISPTGAMEEPLSLADSVSLYPEDVRSLQLAKAAVCAGIRTLLEVSGTSFEEVSALFVAGGFGTHLSMENAGLIGLIPEELTAKAVTLGNAALRGAADLLLDPSLKEKEQRIPALSEHVNLGGNPLFNDCYMDALLFGEE